MRSISTILVMTILLGLLAAVGWFAWAGIAAPGEPMPSERYVALVLGAFTAALVGLGLMTLVFYSSVVAMMSHRVFPRIGANE